MDHAEALVRERISDAPIEAAAARQRGARVTHKGLAAAMVFAMKEAHTPTRPWQLGSEAAANRQPRG